MIAGLPFMGKRGLCSATPLVFLASQLWEVDAAVNVKANAKSPPSRRTIHPQACRDAYAALVDHLPEGFAVIDLRSKQVLAVNDAFAALLGFTCDELRAMSVYDLIAEPPDIIDKYYREAASSQTYIGGFRRYRRKDGTVFYAERTGLVVGDPGSGLLAVRVRRIADYRPDEIIDPLPGIKPLRTRKNSGPSRRTAESQKIADALLASIETLSLAANLAHLGPWRYHPGVNFFEFNDAFYAIYGTDTAHEGPFMDPDTYTREFVHPDDAEFVRNEVQKALASTGGRYLMRFEHRIIRRDREVRVVAAMANIERDETGAVIKWYGANQDITDRVKAAEALRQKTLENERLAFTDTLTGLPNRAHINMRLVEETAGGLSGARRGAVLFIDLDDLKVVNDAFGHTYGDALIVESGNRIVANAGPGAFVGRVGGDEFIVIVPGGQDREAIGRIADRITGAFRETIEILGLSFHITASVGIAHYPADGATAEEIFKNADNAMYAAKRAGKNCWRYFETAMQSEVYDKVLLAAALRTALQRGELSLHYQPVIAIKTGRILGFEALLRWHSAEHGCIPPSRFIPLAEQNGMIHPIGAWVLREVCLFIQRLAGMGQALCVSVNVSPQQLCAAGFLDDIRAALDGAGIQPGSLELEITENVLIDSLEDSTAICNELRAMGIRLALDDFGKGYSSLTRLQRLPVNVLKIDKAFIDQILTGKSIIGNIVDMAHTLGMAVVAEGVETRPQLEYLARNRCDSFQGYLASPPLPEAEAVAFLAKQA